MLNLDLTLSVTQNLGAKSDFPHIWETVAIKRKWCQRAWLRGLRSHFPELVAQIPEQELEEVEGLDQEHMRSAFQSVSERGRIRSILALVRALSRACSAMGAPKSQDQVRSELDVLSERGNQDDESESECEFSFAQFCELVEQTTRL